MSDEPLDLRALLEQRREAGEYLDLIDEGTPKKKAKRKATPKLPPDWSTVVWPAKPYRWISYDQTLTHCGWAIMETGYGTIPWPVDTGTIEVGSGPYKGRGFYQSMWQGDMLFGAVRAQLMGFSPGYIQAIVTEMPSVTGFRTDSSLMASRAVRDAACTVGLRHMCTMVQSQHVKALVSGNGNLPKAQLPKYVAMAYEGTDLLPTRTNEHVRDAIANGLTVAMDGSLVKFIEEGVQ